MHTKNVKLSDIAKVITGLPLQRYLGKGNTVKKDILINMPLFAIKEPFKKDEVDVSEDIKEHFYSREHDILYKVQQQSFAKEITTETDAIIPNTYIIIRVDKQQVNPTFITYYLNDPRVEYEIERNIDSTKIKKVSTKILKDLEIRLPEKEVQDKQVELINKINERIELKTKSIEYDEKLINSLYDSIIGDQYEN